MYIYIAGAMRGIANNNIEQFGEYADQLRAKGYHVISPAESPPPNLQGPPYGRADCLRHDLQIVGIVDAVAVLPNWLDSPGARLEVAVAWALDIPVYDAGRLVTVHPDTGDTVLTQYQVRKTSVVIPRERQYYEGLPLVGLSGYAGAGKDEVAKTLVANGWTRIAFADPLKAVATAIGWSGTKDEVGRKLLQDLGVGVRDHLNPDAWVLAGEESIEGAQGPCVVTDVRFPNELTMIRRRGGQIVRIERPGHGAVNDHVSEHLVSPEDCDAVLLNDGSLEDLQLYVEEFFHLNDRVLQAA